jgi:hypothetical protein
LEVDSNNSSEGLGFSHFCVQSPCSPLIEDYEIFYMIDEGDIPSIQCKMRIREPKFMRKVDGLSLTFIHFYVPELTPRLNNTETSLQLCENITLFAACHIYRGVISKETQIYTKRLGCIIYIYSILYNVKDRTQPCVTPASTSLITNDHKKCKAISATGHVGP